MRIRISATEASRNFSELLNRVRFRGERFVIERNGKPIGELVPAPAPTVTAADFLARLRALARPDPGFFDDLEAALAHQDPVAPSRWPS